MQRTSQQRVLLLVKLYRHMLHEDFQNIVLPSAVKMLKRNPEIVLESVGILLNSVNLDLSKYAVEIISVALPQARHADEGRRVGALAIIRRVSQKSSNPDALEAMFNAVKSVIGDLFLIILLFWESLKEWNGKESCNEERME
ncbi:protein ILITYHIA isoform X2 [Prunus yedoensis var. nudiflora]|uniref:Protein ILITYHIA isoform X2 n=1 Tax=Prunus yedoensis var. nudiflora TaxID=2094558 RepID=A0A314YMS8_PRUYE|nr:protein ILITYHIA isoform X2 [Prunus yedoensis var. nudiflora]